MKRAQKCLLISSLSVTPIIAMTPVFLTSCNEDEIKAYHLNSQNLYNGIQSFATTKKSSDWTDAIKNDLATTINKLLPNIFTKNKENGEESNNPNIQLDSIETIKTETKDSNISGIVTFSIKGTDAENFNYDTSDNVSVDKTSITVKGLKFEGSGGDDSIKISFNCTGLFNALNEKPLSLWTASDNNVNIKNWIEDGIKLTNGVTFVDNSINIVGNKPTNENSKVTIEFNAKIPTNVKCEDANNVKFEKINDNNEYKITVENLTVTNQAVFDSTALYNAINEISSSVEASNWKLSVNGTITSVEAAINQNLKTCSQNKLTFSSIKDISGQGKNGIVKFDVSGNLNELFFDKNQHVTIDGTNTIVVDNLTVAQDNFDINKLYDTIKNSLNGVVEEAKWNNENDEIYNAINKGLQQATTNGSISCDKNTINDVKVTGSNKGSFSFDVNPDLTNFKIINDQNANVQINKNNNKTITINDIELKSAVQVAWEAINNNKRETFNGLTYSTCAKLFDSNNGWKGMFSKDCTINTWKNNDIDTAIKRIENCQNLNAAISKSSNYAEGKLVITLSGQYGTPSSSYSIEPVEVTISGFKTINNNLKLDSFELDNNNLLNEKITTESATQKWPTAELDTIKKYITNIKCSINNNQPENGDSSTTFSSSDNNNLAVFNSNEIKTISFGNGLVIEKLIVIQDVFEYNGTDWVPTKKDCEISNPDKISIINFFPKGRDVLKYINDNFYELDSAKLNEISASELKHTLVKTPMSINTYVHVKNGNEQNVINYINEYMNSSGVTEQTNNIKVSIPNNISSWNANDIEGILGNFSYDLIYNDITYRVTPKVTPISNNCKKINVDWTNNEDLTKINKTIVDLDTRFGTNFKTNIIDKRKNELLALEKGAKLDLSNDSWNPLTSQNITDGIIFKNNPYDDASNSNPTNHFNNFFFYSNTNSNGLGLANITLLGTVYSNNNSNVFPNDGLITINNSKFYVLEIKLLEYSINQEIIKTDVNNYTYNLTFKLSIKFGSDYALKEIPCTLTTTFNEII